VSERRPHLWCIFDRRSSRVIEGLLFDEARAFLSNQDAADIENFLVWKEEWPDWRPVNEIEGLTEMIFRALHVSPPPPPRGTERTPMATATRSPVTEISSVIVTKVSEAFPQQELDSVSITSGEFVIRSQKRFRKRMAVTIIGTENQMFKTFTRDISVGGMYLEDSAPNWVKGYFKVRISKPNSKQLIELNCGVLETQPDGARYRVAILPLQSVEDEKNLENWFAA
jgi:PilZ domain